VINQPIEQRPGIAGSFPIDLHIHTTAGSADSNLRPAVLSGRAREVGLGALLITEHFRVWRQHEAEDLAAATGVPVLRGMEWNTDLGHIIVLGVERYLPELRAAADLRRHVLDQGGLMIAAHPFRHAFDPIPALWKAHKSSDVSLDAACRHPMFAYVDAIEVVNGACTDRENDLARRVATALGLPGVGGSDAHYAEDVGRALTLLEHPVHDDAALIAAIRAGRVRAVRTAMG
jgi:predicted metal-dependent phosphoesterase TrpH